MGWKLLGTLPKAELDRVDAVSYTHLMMLVVFTLADLGMKALGMPGYIVIVILGNIFIMALEALLVCIHVYKNSYN